MRVVLDTNILVSSFINPEGGPGRIVDLVKKGDPTLLLDSRILYEYRDVLHRYRFGFSSSAIDDLLAFFDRFGEFVTTTPLAIKIPDPDDLPFLEVALSGRADALITGNRKDFGRPPKDLKIVSPSVFLAEIAPKFYEP